MTPVEPPRSIFRQVVDRLGAAISRGDYGDGALPVEADLASSLGVSRSILREAIKVLASKNLVVVRTKTGTAIRPREQWNVLDPDVLLWLSQGEGRLLNDFDLVEFRLIVEPRAAHLAALRATAVERRAIAAACTALEACVVAPQYIASRDLAFHQAILTASHNTLVASIGAHLGIMMQAQVRTTTDYAGAFERGLPLHREVTQAIAEGDAGWAESASRRLVLMPYADLADRVKVPIRRRLDNRLDTEPPGGDRQSAIKPDLSE